MKGIVSIVLLMVVGLTIAADDLSNIENVDVDGLLANPRLLKGYIRCLLGEAGCSREGRMLKKALPDALKTGCNSCSARAKAMMEKVITHFKEHRAEDWQRLLDKYDPKGEYKKRFESNLQKTRA